MISVDIPFGFQYFTNPKKHQNITCRYGSYVSATVLHVYIVYFFAGGVRMFFSGFDLKIGLAYTFINLLSFSLWHSLNIQEKRIRKLVSDQTALMATLGATSSFSIRDACILALLTITPVVYAGVNAYFAFRGYGNLFYSFGYRVESPYFKCLLYFLGTYGYCLVYNKWPCMALWSLCHILHQGQSILRTYERKLKLSFSSRSSPSEEVSPQMAKSTWSSDGNLPKSSSQTKPSISQSSSSIPEGTWKKTVVTTQRRAVLSSTDGLKLDYLTLKTQPFSRVISRYFEIVETIRLLKNALSMPSLFITMISLSSLYAMLSSVLLGLFPSVISLQDLIINSFTGCTVLVSLGFLGAEIPKRMEGVRNACCCILNANEIGDVLAPKEVALLQRMEKVKKVHITANDFVTFSKSFILTSFGSLLTFGLLLFNLNLQ